MERPRARASGEGLLRAAALHAHARPSHSFKKIARLRSSASADFENLFTTMYVCMRARTRNSELDHIWEFMSFSSYGMGTQSSGAVQVCTIARAHVHAAYVYKCTQMCLCTHMHAHVSLYTHARTCVWYT